jgi:hypothetical protein
MSDVPFGQDFGMNYRPSNDVSCRDPFKSVVPFKVGQKIRMLWPAKNHAAASCTNPYIPKGTLYLYAESVTNFNQPDLPFSKWTTEPYRIFNFPKGFQNCPDFCPETERVPCYGDYVWEKAGKFKVIWVWMFNPNEYYTHCFDVEIQGGAIVPSTRPPSSSLQPSSKRPSQGSSLKPSSPVSCQAIWKPCDSKRPCCNNLNCIFKNPYYSQCEPGPKPSSSPPSESPKSPSQIFVCKSCTECISK